MQQNLLLNWLIEFYGLSFYIIHTVCGKIYDKYKFVLKNVRARYYIYQNFSSPNKYYVYDTHRHNSTIYIYRQSHNAMNNIILYNVIIKTLRTESKTFNIAKVKQFHFTLYNLFFMRLLNFRFFFLYIIEARRRQMNIIFKYTT